MTKKIKIVSIILVVLFLCVMLNRAYAKYVISKEADTILYTAPFYFNVTSPETEYPFTLKKVLDSKGNYKEADSITETNVNLNIFNNDGNNFNFYETEYTITIDNNNFSIIEGNKVVNSVSKKIKGNLLVGDTIPLTLRIKDFKKEAEIVNLKVTSTSPYKKEISIPINISIFEFKETLSDFRGAEFSDSSYGNDKTEDDFDDLYGDNDGKLEYDDDGSIILDEDNMVPVFDRSSKNYENGYSVNITIKGDIYQYPAPASKDASGNITYDRWGPATIFAMTTEDVAPKNTLCWFGFRNGYFQIYSFSYSTIPDVDGDYTDEDGFVSRQIDDKYNNKILNIQVTGEENGMTYVYFNGSLFTSFKSGNGTTTFDNAIVGDLRILRGLKFTGNFYDVAIYDRILTQKEIEDNWLYTKYTYNLDY